MKDIIDDYRKWSMDQPDRVSTHSEQCHLWHKDCMIHRLAHEVIKLRSRAALTDQERRAIRNVIPLVTSHHAGTLRGLLERTE